MTMAEINKRMAEIEAREPEEMTARESASLAAAEREDDGSTMTLEEFQQKKEYSGKLMLRIPKELHQELANAAAQNGVSLNQYALYKLAR